MFNCVLDKIEAQFPLWLYINVMDSSASRKDAQLKQLTTQLYNLLEQVYTSNGNIATKLYKSLEPMIIGIVLHHLDAQYNDYHFVEPILNDLHEVSPHIGHCADRIVLLLRQ